MKKQLILISDMEGASGIFDEDFEFLINGKDEWRRHGRERMTSDILAVCEAAIEFGIDEILYYDAHYAGNPESNVFLEQLPPNVKLIDTPNRCFDWRRIRGQAQIEPFGLITVGQHARNGEKNAYFPHTIQTPPIKGFWVNGIHIAEIGMAVLNFQGVKYIANIGCEASKKEARELSQKVKHISVKDKSKNWEPSTKETYPLIKTGILKALKEAENAEAVMLKEPFTYKLELCKYYYFDKPNEVSWKGNFTQKEAYWESPSVEIGMEIFNFVREYISITKEDNDRLKKERLCGEYKTME